jgi:hypothetical protein
MAMDMSSNLRLVKVLYALMTLRNHDDRVQLCWRLGGLKTNTKNLMMIVVSCFGSPAGNCICDVLRQ